MSIEDRRIGLEEVQVPGEEFYSGAELGEQIARFIEHHYDPSNRHISAYEAAMLDRARARIEGEEAAGEG